jgi:tRNA threonylcarbamoyladenosine biosynthesis protein TsaE
MSESHLELHLPDSAATEALGNALARAYLSTGLGSAVVYLRGDLGAGKTTCVRSLLRAPGVVGLIRSPTYTLVEAYPLPAVTCVHVDLYRLQGPVEVDELGLRDYFDGECLLLVEWPEKGATVLPPADLVIGLFYLGTGRGCRVESPSVRGRAWLERLAHDTSLTSYVSNLT